MMIGRKYVSKWTIANCSLLWFPEMSSFCMHSYPFGIWEFFPAGLTLCRVIIFHDQVISLSNTRYLSSSIITFKVLGEICNRRMYFISWSSMDIYIISISLVPSLMARIVSVFVVGIPSVFSSLTFHYWLSISWFSHIQPISTYLPRHFDTVVSYYFFNQKLKISFFFRRFNCWLTSIPRF